MNINQRSSMGPPRSRPLLATVTPHLPVNAWSGDSRFSLPQQHRRGRRTKQCANVAVHFPGRVLGTEADEGWGREFKQIFTGNACKISCPQAPHLPNRKNKSKVKFDTSLCTVNGIDPHIFHRYLQQIP